MVFWRLWERLGLHQLFQEWYRASPVEFPLEKPVFGRAYFPPFEGVELHHLYLALDFLEEHIREAEVALFLRGRDLLNVDGDGLLRGHQHLL